MDIVPTRAEDIFARHHRDVFRFLARMTGNRDMADDLCQDVFLRVVRALQHGDPPTHERGWIFAIARHLLIDHRRHRRPGVDPADLRSASVSATQALAYGLSEALASLPDDHREVFLLREVAGLNYADIAAACGCSVEAVRSRLSRTRIRLRTCLEPPRTDTPRRVENDHDT